MKSLSTNLVFVENAKRHELFALPILVDLLTEGLRKPWYRQTTNKKAYCPSTEAIL
jgi:hypothetical protein